MTTLQTKQAYPVSLTFSKIIRKSGRKPTECKCEKCKSQCRTPCLGTPEDIMKLIEAGYEDRLAPTSWHVGMLLGVHDRPIEMVQARIEDNGWCTFYHDGLCELHDKGLKPTEGRLSHHSIKLDNFVPKKSLAWLVAKEWIKLEGLLMTSRQIAEFQMMQDRLCVPFDVFHKAAEEALGRPVWTHEFADCDSLLKELMGDKEPPTFEEIINLIPEEKRILIKI